MKKIKNIVLLKHFKMSLNKMKLPLFYYQKKQILKVFQFIKENNQQKIQQILILNQKRKEYKQNHKFLRNN